MNNPYPSASPGVPGSSMPTGAPGIVPRRSSYASVVSGAASQYANARSGAFSHLMNSQNDHVYDPNYQNLGGYSRYDSRNLDIDFTNGSGHGHSGSWGRGGQLSTFSSAFGTVLNANGYGASSGGNSDSFFTPSYLQGSKYVQRLEAAHKSKVSAQKDGASAQSSQPGSLSTTPSSINFQTKPPSHRGVTHEVLEKSSTSDDDELLSPLPSRWSEKNKHSALELLSDGQEVKCIGQKSERDRDHEACAIKADHPMPPQCGIYYFEVTIVSRKREESSIGIGFSSKDVSLARLPGWEPESWAYHGDDGNSFCCQSSGKHYGPPFTHNDTIGCGVNFRTGCAFFTKNGVNLGTAFREIKASKGRLFPSIGMKKSGEQIRVNFGQSKFIFDIDGMMESLLDANCSHLSSNVTVEQENRPRGWLYQLYEEFRSIMEKRLIREEIEEASTAKLAPPLSETDLVQSLVIQFLKHEGYLETAKAFASEVYSEKKALSLDPNAIIGGFDVKEDENAGHRQRIRAAVLDGDVEKALKHTNVYYPNVLKDNEHVYFRLRCRKFIEMIHQAAQINRSRSTNGSKKSNGHNGYWDDDIINHDMDLDDDQNQPTNDDLMDTEDGPSNGMKEERLLADAVAYGKELAAEFKDDPRREVGKALEDAFALIAYQDPFNEKEVSHLLDLSGRVTVAEELNSAILISLGKPSSAALERLIQQSTVILEDLQESGGPGSLVNIDDYTKVDC